MDCEDRSSSDLRDTCGLCQAATTRHGTQCSWSVYCTCTARSTRNSHGNIAALRASLGSLCLIPHLAVLTMVANW